MQIHTQLEQPSSQFGLVSKDDSFFHLGAHSPGSETGAASLDWPQTHAKQYGWRIEARELDEHSQQQVCYALWLLECPNQWCNDPCMKANTIRAGIGIHLQYTAESWQYAGALSYACRLHANLVVAVLAINSAARCMMAEQLTLSIAQQDGPYVHSLDGIPSEFRPPHQHSIAAASYSQEDANVSLQRSHVQHGATSLFSPGAQLQSAFFAPGFRDGLALVTVG